MSFTSFDFLVFLVLAIGVRRAVQAPSPQKWLLIILSYLFYLSAGIVGVPVITLTALVDFNAARRLSRATIDRTRKLWLWTSLWANLGALIFFKYADFLTQNVALILHPLGIRLLVPEYHFLLPVGLSYFTFSGISYVLDVYYEKIEPAQNVSEYISYLTYFPKLLAGPIVRAGQLMPHLRHGTRITAKDVEIGCGYLLVGAVKKLVIADQLSSHVGMILASPNHYNAFTLLQGMLGYTAQIYADFSGYSDMAIGCARLMGIEFPQNFLMPYSSVNIGEFWRRWHVTLSTWFRDYVFLPLEVGSRRNQNANVRACRNLMITMLLCGLWHGASWNFVLWGGLHGLALATYQVYSNLRHRQVRRRAGSRIGFRTLAARGLTLTLVMVGWILFGTGTLTAAVQYLWRMLTWTKDGVALGSPYILPLTAVVILAHLVIDKNRNLIEEMAEYSLPARAFGYATLVLALTTLVPSEAVPFVYVQF